MEDQEKNSRETLLEVELKFTAVNKADVVARLNRFGAMPLPIEHHEDTYFRHPCRDFIETGEALRIRKVNGVAHITYKGPKLAGPVKIRPEMEWSLAPGDTFGEQTAQLWSHLGFAPVATVKKTRQPYRWTASDGTCTIAVDEVEEIGVFVEVERVVSSEDLDVARALVIQRGEQLGLSQIEPRSYINMWVNRHGPSSSHPSFGSPPGP